MTTASPNKRFPGKQIVVVLCLLPLFIPTPLIARDVAHFQQDPQKPVNSGVRTLELSKPITEEVTPDQLNRYELVVQVGQFVRVVVDQLSINVALTAVDPLGKTILDADAFNAGGPEESLFIAEVAGTYRFEVRVPDRNALPGRYEIGVRELRPSTENDKKLVSSHKLAVEGFVLYRKRTRESFQNATEKFLQSADFARAAGEPGYEANALFMAAACYLEIGDKEKALELNTRGLPVAEIATQSTDPERKRLGIQAKAYLLDGMGLIQNSFGDKKKALEYFQQALLIRRTIDDRFGEANTLNNIAMAYGGMGDWSASLDALLQVRKILHDLGSRRDEATVLSNICFVSRSLGKYETALATGRESVEINRQLKNLDGEANALNNLGSVHSSLGAFQEALDSYNRALEIYKQTGSRASEAIELHNIAWVYAALGDKTRANDFYGKALQIFRELGNKASEAQTLSNIATNYGEAGDHKKALELHLQVLALNRAVSDSNGEANTLNNLGTTYAKLGDRQKSLDYYTQALILQRKVGNLRNLANTLKNIGTANLELSQPDKALEYLNEGLQITRTIGDRSNEAGILAAFARLERERGNLIAARERIDNAISTFETLRTNIKSQQLRATFSASFRTYHEFNVDLLMRLHRQQPQGGFDGAAFEASEKGRSRSLLELLTEASAEIRRDVDQQLLKRERTLRQQIVEKAERQIRLRSGNHSEEQAKRSTAELDALTTEYDQVLAAIRQTSPRYAALTQPQPLTLKEIQSQLLNDETVLLHYSLGDPKSFLWAVTPNSIRSFELPSRPVIEASARKVYELITAANQTVQGETTLARFKRIEESDSQYATAAMQLSQMLLGPAAGELPKKRLVITVEGILQYIPFAALPEPSSTGGPTQPLVFNHEIVSLPSASVLGVLRKEAGKRGAPPKTVAVLADPVFEKTDQRLSRSRPAHVTDVASSEVKRSAEESGLQSFVRLRFSRQEAEHIERLVPPGKGFKALDFSANRPTALADELADYRIIHFATHGLINNQHPDLSGIVLSLVNEQGQPQNGFVRLYDIYNMNLKAELVVLSACQTALGTDIKGEGLVGLTRAFMYAGAPRVVASMWQVEDRATAEMMRRFYQGMLTGGLSPAAALRTAQISMFKENRWRAPRYWAAFTLQGEWK